MSMRKALLENSIRWIPSRSMSHSLGKLADRQLHPTLLRPFLNIYRNAWNVDLHEAAVPQGGFRSFNEFFTRPLRDGARPIDAASNTLISPADGRIEAAGPITQDLDLVIKGTRYTLPELMGDDDDAAQYAGGDFLVIYLSPREYHRVHAPVDGEISHLRHMQGTLYPVNKLGVNYVPKLFSRNERVAIFIDNAVWGPTAVIMVGAMGVGRICLSFDDLKTNQSSAQPPVSMRRYADPFRPKVVRGDELGMFCLGSTVILAYPPQAQPLERSASLGDFMHMGERLVGHGEVA